jgi:hypothetical protein
MALFARPISDGYFFKQSLSHLGRIRVAAQVIGAAAQHPRMIRPLA